MKKSNNSIESVLVVVIGLLLFFAFTKQIWFFRSALLIGLLGLLSNTFTGWIAFILQQITRVLGYVNARVLLSLVFFIILVPLAFLQRMFKKDVLQLKRPTKSMYKERNHLFEPKDLENMW